MPMLLGLTPCGAKTRRCLGQRHQPSAQANGLECRDLPGSQLRVDEVVEAVARVGGRLTVSFEKTETAPACRAHRQRSDDPSRRMLPLAQSGAVFCSRLLIVQ